MDQRLKSIIDNLDTMKVGLDDTFEFQCNQCGKCCLHREDIIFPPYDLYRIAQKEKRSIKEVIDQYCECYIGNSSKIPIVHLLAEGSEKRCPFLKNKKCSIQDAKPAVCALYPLGRCTIVKENKNDTLKPDELHYILQKVDCNSGGRKYTVREWLEKSHIDIEDKSYQSWHMTTMELNRLIVKMIEHPEWNINMEEVWSITFLLLYIHYDLTKSYQTQFDHNVNELFSLLKGLVSEKEATFGRS